MSAAHPLATVSLAANTLRGLAIDAVEKAKSGHPGMPMGCADLAAELWLNHLKHNPADPHWRNRDRFVLSAGHGSMLIYGLLHLCGYDVTMDDLQAFRQWGSRTPGHPENHLTPGVEMATGPLGQGISTAVGMAIAEANLAARFNRPGHEIVDHFTYVIASDGDLMEGVAQEACSIAGHLGLGKLIVIYDDNGITIDGGTELAFTEDTPAKFEAMGWHVQKVDGHDSVEVGVALARARMETAKPSILCARTTIGFGSPNKAGKSSSHGSPLGADEVKITKEKLGIPLEPTFYVPAEMADLKVKIIAEGAAKQASCEANWNEYALKYPELANEFEAMWTGRPFTTQLADLELSKDPMATRAANGIVLQAAAADFPGLMGGSADLTHNVMTEIKGAGYFTPQNRQGRNISFGVREHAMAAIANGLTLHGATRGIAGTFLMFSDYCRPSIRLAALMQCPTIFCFSHDSIGLGEDGPTHQPVEHYAALRSIPNLNFMRPADANEVKTCWQLATESTDSPSIIATSRQNLPLLTPADRSAEKGAYILIDADKPQLCLVATGSEVQHAVEAAKMLAQDGVKVRVVSMPSWFLFEKQPEAYRKSVIDRSIPTLSVECGVSLGWAKYADAHVALDGFGASAPGPVLMDKFGFTAANVVASAKAMLGEPSLV